MAFGVGKGATAGGEDTSAVNVTFNAPVWLNGLGRTSWLIVGVALVVLGGLRLLSMTSTIVMPLAVATVLAVICAPVVSRLAAHGIPRGVGTSLLVISFVIGSLLLGAFVVGGLVSESSDAVNRLESASGQLATWAKDLGADDAKVVEYEQKARNKAGDYVETLLRGTAEGVRGLAGALFFLTLTAISLIFILKDAPGIRDWTERHMGVPEPIARKVTGSVIVSLRQYFIGMTILAFLTSAILGVAALLLGVPLAATIALVAFVTVYIPYLGAVIGALFAILVAVAGGSGGAVIAMLIVCLLVYGLLHPLVQPMIFGSTLEIHPLVALVATIAGGSLFGILGLILTAPLVAAVTHLTIDLIDSRAVVSEDPAN